MAILIDPITTHGDDDTGNDTVPPGITGLDWCHCVSDTSLAELQDFLTNNPAINCDPVNIRTPQDTNPSVATYVGMNTDQRDQAIFAGAQPFNFRHVIANDFDSGATSLYEPLPGI